MKPKTRHILYMFIPLIVSIIYMLFSLITIKDALWFGESYPAYIIRGDLGETWSLAFTTGQLPCFCVLLKIWSFIFGNTEVSLRFMSIFFGAITIILTFHLLKRWLGAKISSILTLAFALSPFFIFSGSKISPYTLIFAIVVGVIYFIDTKLEKRKSKYRITIICKNLKDKLIKKFKPLKKLALKLNPQIAPLIIPLVLLVASITFAIISAINLGNREPKSYIKDIYSLTSEMAEENEPIIMNNVWNYYDAIFYTSDKHPVYLLSSEVGDEEYPKKPAKTYHYNIIDDLGGFKLGHNKFWYIVDASENTEKLKLPLDGYRVVNEISNGRFTALELMKE